MVVLVPSVGSAQTYFQPTPTPQVTAANADWQMKGEPVFYAGNFYWPTGPTVFFDGAVMVRSGTYQGVPLYSDTSVSPYSVIYVPIGRNVVRPYERRRTGELVGSVGSRTPSFPTERDVDVSVASVRTGAAAPVPVDVEPVVIAEGTREPRAVGTSGTFPPAIARESTTVERTRPRRTVIESIPRPSSNRGIWLAFNGARWYSAGTAIPYSADRFIPIGEHRGFPVYREIAGNADTIYVAAVKNGPLAPYRR